MGATEGAEPGTTLKMTEETHHLKPVELAKALRVSPSVVSRWAKDGTITPAFKVGKVIRYDLDAVKSELKARLVAGD